VPLYKQQLDELRKTAQEKGLPVQHGWERQTLEEHIEQVNKWEEMDCEQLRQVAKTHLGYSKCTPATKAEMVQLLISVMFHGDGVAAASSQAPSAPTGPVPLYKQQLDELRKTAQEKGLPVQHGWERQTLEEHIEQVNKWEEMDCEQLRQVAKTHLGYSKCTPATKAEMVQLLIGVTFGRAQDSAPSLRPAATSVPTRPAPPAASSVPKPATPLAEPASMPQPKAMPQQAAFQSTLPRPTAEPAPVASSPPAPATRSVPERPQATDMEFADEVRRINLVPPGARDHIGIFGLMTDREQSKKRYRELILLLHPDKRRPALVERAGGKEACDSAMARVQAAWERVQRPNALVPHPAGYPPHVQTPAQARARAQAQAQTQQPQVPQPGAPPQPPPPSGPPPVRTPPPGPPPPPVLPHDGVYAARPLGPPAPSCSMNRLIYAD